MKMNYVSFEKLSKKAQKAENSRKRNTWGSINPVTRVAASKKAYNRQKFKRGEI